MDMALSMPKYCNGRSKLLDWRRNASDNRVKMGDMALKTIMRGVIGLVGLFNISHRPVVPVATGQAGRGVFPVAADLAGTGDLAGGFPGLLHRRRRCSRCLAPGRGDARPLLVPLVMLGLALFGRFVSLARRWHRPRGDPADGRRSGDDHAADASCPPQFRGRAGMKTAAKILLGTAAALVVGVVAVARLHQAPRSRLAGGADRAQPAGRLGAGAGDGTAGPAAAQHHPDHGR